jgi:hypothetical protein
MSTRGSRNYAIIEELVCSERKRFQMKLTKGKIGGLSL